jgi:glycerol kinase
MNFLLAIDQGTTGTTALIIDAKNLEILAKEKIDYPQIYPKPGWVEHDLNDIWQSVKASTESVLKKSGANPKDIIAIGITNQRETTCAFDKSGRPLHHAIVWQDRRTSHWCDQFKAEYEKNFRAKTGLPLDPYFSATKMKWLLENSAEVKRARDNNQLYLSTIDSFLIYRLSAGEAFVTEATNASRTMLMNLQTLNWDESLLSFFNIPSESLAQIKDSFSHFGKTKNVGFLPDGIPILSVLGDQQAALFGQAGVDKGDLKATYGTGAFLLLNTGEEIIKSSTGLLTTVAYSFKNQKSYALEGSAYIAGAAVQWLRDNLKCIQSSDEVTRLAESVEDNTQMEHILFLPFFTGIGTPYWNSEAKAAIVGLTRDSHNGHIARACLEGIALSLNDSVRSFKNDFPHLNDIRVDGGASANNLLMQLQANFSDKVILRPRIIDTTAYGVALGALVGKGELHLNDLKKHWKLDQQFQPDKNLYYKNKQSLWDLTLKKLYL